MRRRYHIVPIHIIYCMCVCVSTLEIVNFNRFPSNFVHIFHSAVPWASPSVKIILYYFIPLWEVILSEEGEEVIYK